MKKITFLFLFAIAFVANAQVSNYDVGDVVDDFTVTDIHGVEHNLYDITATGKYVFLDFFFDTCGPCQATTPIFNEFYDKYGCNEGDIYCISINDGTDSDAEVEAFEETYGGSFNHAPAVSADGGAEDVDSNFGIVAYPTFCIVGPDNTLVNKDIWPIAGVETYEDAFPTGFNPEPMECSLGLLDAANTSDFLLYPTVSNGRNINIRLGNQVDSAKVTVLDVSGKQIFTNEFTSSDIVINVNASAGTYFVKVQTNSGFTVKRLIIK